jgi:peptide chain release factor 2
MQELEQLRSEVDQFDTLFQSAKDIVELSAMITDKKEWDDIAVQVENLERSVEKLDFLTLFNEKYDVNGAIVTIHAGAGGVDAQDWASMLLKMYLRWAERKKYTVKILDEVAGAEAGIKSATIEIDGRWVYGHMRAEAGVHRLVRLSPFNADNLRQTSFARVEAMPILKEIKEVQVKQDELRIDTYRSSGAGGQHVNTTDSAVRVTHLPTGLQAQCQNERSQAQNKESAMKLLMAKLHKNFIEEEERKKKELRGEMVEAGWGNQIRSYVLHPYKMVKDHRTKYETVQVDDVLDGDIDDFVIAFLRR